MKRKIIIYGILYCCLLLVSGCGLNKSKSQEVIEFQEPVARIINSETEDQENITDEDMKRFFEQYLTIDEQSILILNQKPKIVNDEYWGAYRAYKAKTNEILGEYLSADTKKKLNKHYIHDDFHYPRFLEINDYFIIGIANVEDAIIVSKQFLGNISKYEVMVTAIAKVINIDWANKKYGWDESKGYYIKNIDSDIPLGIEPGADRIKVTLNYWVEVPVDGVFSINSVKEKGNIYLGIDEQASAKNNSFVSRIPYLDKVTEKDKEKIHKFLDSFMKQEYNFYNYYRKAYNTNYEMLKMALVSDLRLGNVVNLKEEDYQSYFSPLIIPITDDMDSLTFDIAEDVTITPHISSSKKHSVYEVVVKADVTLINTKVIPYDYIYLFIFENDIISSVRFITQNQIMIETTSGDT